MSNSPESQLLGRKDDFVASAKGPRRLAQGVSHLLSSHAATLPKEVPGQGQRVCARVCVCPCLFGGWQSERKSTKTLNLLLTPKDTVSLMKLQ